MDTINIITEYYKSVKNELSVKRYTFHNLLFPTPNKKRKRLFMGYNFPVGEDMAGLFNSMTKEKTERFQQEVIDEHLCRSVLGGKPTEPCREARRRRGRVVA
jgi:hypothetical protein